MAQFSKSAKTQRVVANHSFDVAVSRPSNGSTNAPTDVLATQFGTDEISGLNKGSVNIIEYRGSGVASPYKDLLPGLPTTAPVTFRGIYMYDLVELKQLNQWYEECIGGNVKSDMIDRYRSITITPRFKGKNSKSLIESPFSDGTFGSIRLVNCLCTNLTITDFNQTSPNASQWQLEIRYKRMEVTEGGGF